MNYSSISKYELIRLDYPYVTNHYAAYRWVFYLFQEFADAPQVFIAHRLALQLILNFIQVVQQDLLLRFT